MINIVIRLKYDRVYLSVEPPVFFANIYSKYREIKVEGLVQIWIYVFWINLHHKRRPINGINLIACF